MKTTIDNLGAGPKTALLRRMPVSLAAALLLMASTALCQAHSVLVTAQNIWSNDVIYTAEMNTVADSGCEKQVVGTAQIIEVTDPKTGLLNSYEFLFWDINAAPYTTTQVNFQPICGVPNTAVAEYLPLGPGCSPTPVAGCPPTTDTVLAYSLNDSKIISTPQITGYGNFKDWLAIGGSTLDTSSSLSITGVGEILLALYGIPDPDPCASLRIEYEAQIESCVGDGLSPKACATLAKALSATVEACETKNGEEKEL
jgi:hypothetical protein